MFLEMDIDCLLKPCKSKCLSWASSRSNGKHFSELVCFISKKVFDLMIYFGKLVWFMENWWARSKKQPCSYLSWVKLFYAKFKNIHKQISDRFNNKQQKKSAVQSAKMRKRVHRVARNNSLTVCNLTASVHKISSYIVFSKIIKICCWINAAWKRTINQLNV